MDIEGWMRWPIEVGVIETIDIFLPNRFRHFSPQVFPSSIRRFRLYGQLLHRIRPNAFWYSRRRFGRRRHAALELVSDQSDVDVRCLLSPHARRRRPPHLPGMRNATHFRRQLRRSRYGLLLEKLPMSFQLIRSRLSRGNWRRIFIAL